MSEKIFQRRINFRQVATNKSLSNKESDASSVSDKSGLVKTKWDSEKDIPLNNNISALPKSDYPNINQNFFLNQYNIVSSELGNRKPSVFVVDKVSCRNISSGNFNEIQNDEFARYKNNNSGEASSFKTIAAMFFKKSSVYALNQVANSKTRIRKFFWSFLMVVGLIGCCSQIIRYLTAYYKYPVVVNVDTVSEFSQTFPAVTICNLNSVRKRFIPCVLQRLSYEECNETLYTDQCEDKFLFNISQPNCFKENNKTFNPETLQTIWFYFLHSKVDANSRKNYGHQKETFIKSCSFNHEICSHADFTLYQDPSFGNCYTFNKGYDNKPPLNTSFIGPNGGLQLELDLETNEYFWLTEREGTWVVIHDPYDDPEPGEEGLSVSPGFETNIAVSKITFSRLPYPYKDKCTPYQSGDNQRKCEAKCFRDAMYSACSCQLPFQTVAEDARYCDLENDAEICCIFQKVEEIETKCQCPLECEVSSYDIKLSSAMWPSEAYMHIKSKKIPPRLVDAFDKNIPPEEFRKFNLKLKVYYDTLQHVIYRQKPMFDDSEVLSQIGGQMGLWLGVSLIAIFECVENLVLMWQFWRNNRSLDRI